MRGSPLLAAGIGAGLLRGDQKCTPTEKVELYMTLDSTASFKRYMPLAQTFIPDFLDRLISVIPNLKAGMSYFGDRNRSIRDKDRCFQQIIPITDDMDAVKKEASNLKQLFNGGDDPESSLSAMGYAAGTAAGFSTPVAGDNTIRILMVVTDDKWQAGDEMNHAENPGTVEPCPTKNPYPLPGEVADVMKSANVFPLVLIVPTYVDYWKEKLTRDLGYTDRTSMVRTFDLNADGKTLADGLLEAVIDFSCAKPNEDPSVTPPATTPPATPPPAITTTTADSVPDDACCSVCAALH